MSFFPRPTDEWKHFLVKLGTLFVVIEDKHTNLWFQGEDFDIFGVLFGVPDVSPIPMLPMFTVAIGLKISSLFS